MKLIFLQFFSLAAEKAAEKGDTSQLEIIQEAKDAQRILERASLRHKHTSSHVRDKKRYAKYSEEERAAIAERENLHKELVENGKKVDFGESSDEEVIRMVDI